MAILWSRQVGDTRYEVRSAGQSRRLYTNGVLHSQYNERQPVTGSVWDLLLLPAFFRDPKTIRRVLVLGVGGGAVLRQLHRFVAPDTLIGVDIEGVHLDIARRYFNVTPGIATLVEADARAWLAAYDGPPFDLVIDDLFGHVDGEPERAIAMDTAWAGALLKHLAPQGVLVANFPDRSAFSASALATNRRLRERFAACYRLTTPMNQNAVAACLRMPASRADLRRQLAKVQALDTRRKSCRLRFRVYREG